MFDEEIPNKTLNRGVDSKGCSKRSFQKFKCFKMSTGGSYLTNRMTSEGDGWSFKANKMNIYECTTFCFDIFSNYF